MRNIGGLVSESAEEVIWSRTLLPFYAAFVGPDRQRELVCGIKTDSPQRGGVFGKLGLSFQRTPLPTYMRTCPACLEEDRKIRGETYWRRAHQLQGVHYCIQHEIALLETDIEIRPIGGGRQEASCADLGMMTRPYLPILSRADEALLMKISELGVSVLNERRCLTLEQQKFLYRDSLRRAGFMKNSEWVDNVPLSREFNSFYGTEVLRLLHSNVEEDSVHSWLRRVIRTQEGCNTTVHRLLLEHFLASCVSENRTRQVMTQGPWLCQNPIAEHHGKPTITRYTLTKGQAGKARAGRFACSCGYEFTARLSEVDASGQPVKMYVTKHGDTYVAKVKELAEAGFPHTRIARMLNMGLRTVRRMLDGVIARRSHNGTGLLAQVMRAKQAGAILKIGEGLDDSPFVNWASRNELLREKVLEAANQLRMIEPPQRITKAAIMKIVGHRSFAVQLRDGMLPRVEDALRQSVETVDAIRCRRVRWLYETWPSDIPLTAWRLGHLAGVRSGQARGEAVALISRLVYGRDSVD